MGVRVLLVEDDPRIRRSLGWALGDRGYSVLEAATGEQALALVTSEPVDVVLLDLMLPGIDGFTVCRDMREQRDMPIIMVTARTDSEDVVRGLEVGADDYVTKPLVASELAARITALLRRTRSSHAQQPITRLPGDIELRPGQGMATRGGVDIGLTRTELRLLGELVAAGGDVVSREQLLERVWGYGYFGDTRLLDVHIRRLRRKVESDPANPTLVLTVRGVGYRAAV